MHPLTRPFKAALLVALGALCVSSTAHAVSRKAFHDAMRDLWMDHVAWTRLYIVSVAAGTPDAQLTADRLLRNQKDIGDALVDFYGREAADQLTALLRDHILIAAELVTAAKANDQAKVADANTRWYANANDIAGFLHRANPEHWPLATLESAMKTHLDQTLAEATHRLQGQYAEDIADYDAIVDHILAMADTLSDGIVAQFPEKFDQA